MNDKKPTKMMFITTPELVNTGKCSFIFMMGEARDFYRDTVMGTGAAWGFMATRAKTSNEFAPFDWAENQRKGLRSGDPGYKQCCGDDGIPRLDLHIFQGGKGEILSGGSDLDPEHEIERIQALIEDMTVHVCLLIERKLYDAAEQAAMNLGYETAVFHAKGPLETG